MKFQALKPFGFHDDKYFTIAQILILLNLVSITRAFALTSLIEVILWGLFAFYGPLRLAFVESLQDLRVKLIFLFWFWILLATLWSDASLFLRFEEVWSWRKLVLFPFCLILFQNFELKRLSIFLLLGVASIYMIASWLGFWGVIELDREPSHVLENHSTQGVVFTICSFLALSLMKEIKVSPVVSTILLLLFAGLIGNVLFVLTGRSGFIALLLLGPWAAFIFTERRKLVVGIVVFMSLLIALNLSPRASTAVNDGLTAIGSTIKGDLDRITSMGLRWVFWTNTLQMIQERPLLGTGSGAFKKGYDAQVVSQSLTGWRATSTDDPHQQYLLIAGEQGIIGLIIFLSILIFIGLSPGTSFIVSSVSGILLATFLNGFFNGHFNSFVEGRLFWMMAGILLAGSGRMIDFSESSKLFRNRVTEVKSAFKRELGLS